MGIRPHDAINHSKAKDIRTMKANTSKGSTTRKSKAAPGKKRKKKDAIVLTVLSVGAASVLGLLAWQYIRKRKKAKGSDLDALLTSRSADTTTASYPSANLYTSTPSYVDIPATVDTSTTKKISSGSASTSSATGFPLRKGSKGENVRALQQALIAKYGATVLPKYGADADFGSETVAALKKAGLPASIDESTFNVLVQASTGAIDTSALAMKLLEAAGKRDFNAAISNLKKLKTTADYRQVSSIFSQYPLGLVRKTLVNGLLDAFAQEDQKQQIRYEFIRMGLKYDGSKWSLSGFDGKPIVTVETTSVWINATESIQVPASMVLGAEVTRRLDYTLFENNGKHFLVPSKSIRYL